MALRGPYLATFGELPIGQEFTFQARGEYVDVTPRGPYRKVSAGECEFCGSHGARIAVGSRYPAGDGDHVYYCEEEA